MIRCTIYNCRHNLCCAECCMTSCPRRCLNHPDRCRCSVTGPLPEEARRLHPKGPKGGPRRPKACKYDWDAIVRLKETGLTNRAVADRIGCSPQLVGEVWRRRRAEGGDAHA